VEVAGVEYLEREMEVLRRRVKKHILDASLAIHELSVRVKALEEIGLEPEVIEGDLQPLVDKLVEIIGSRTSGRGELTSTLGHLRSLEFELKELKKALKKASKG